MSMTESGDIAAMCNVWVWCGMSMETPSTDENTYQWWPDNATRTNRFYKKYLRTHSRQGENRNVARIFSKPTNISQPIVHTYVSRVFRNPSVRSYRIIVGDPLGSPHVTQCMANIQNDAITLTSIVLRAAGGARTNKSRNAELMVCDKVYMSMSATWRLLPPMLV
jgi:hypothetical protein